MNIPESGRNTKDIYAPEYIRDLFNTMSVSYERMNYITSFGFSYRWRIQFLKKISFTKPDIHILDLMSGMGETWAPLKNCFPNSKLTALDFCDGMIANAHKNNQGKFRSSVEILKQDVLNNKLPDGFYDAVVCAFGLKTFNEDQLVALAQQIKRVLKPGGQFSFIEVSVPGNTLLQLFYRMYLKYFIPFLGKLMRGSKDEYRMLWKYTSNFINSEKATKLFLQEGLQAKQENYFFGCASGISGYKKEE